MAQRGGRRGVEACRRSLLFRLHGPSLSIKGKVAIIVDDGVATGLTILATIQELRADHPASIIAAVPVAPDNFARLLPEDIQLVTLQKIGQDC